MLRLAATALASALTLTACAGGSPPSTEGRLRVVGAFHAVEYAAQQVGGNRVTVASLTKPGGEPHDLELLPRQILQVRDADLTVYLKDFQPEVDAAVERHASTTSLDVGPAADLIPFAAGHEGESHEEHAAHAEEGHDDHDHDHEGHDHDDHDGHDHDHEGHAHDEHDGHDHGAHDPHFWLDPIRYAAVAEAIAAALSAKDPAGAATYDANAAAFRQRLTDLDREYAAGLAQCRTREFVTGHAAFGYLAQRYDLVEASVSGLSPEVEPTATSMSAVVRFVRDHGIHTVYSEALASPALVETLARETGASVSMLDPIEGITTESAAPDYFGIMRANLANLRAGQECT